MLHASTALTSHARPGARCPWQLWLRERTMVGRPAGPPRATFSAPEAARPPEHPRDRASDACARMRIAQQAWHNLPPARGSPPCFRILLTRLLEIDKPIRNRPTVRHHQCSGSCILMLSITVTKHEPMQPSIRSEANRGGNGKSLPP